MWYTASVLEQGSARQSALFFSFVALGVPVKLLSFSGSIFQATVWLQNSWKFLFWGKREKKQSYFLFTTIDKSGQKFSHHRLEQFFVFV